MTITINDLAEMINKLSDEENVNEYNVNINFMSASDDPKKLDIWFGATIIDLFDCDYYAIGLYGGYSSRLLAVETNFIEEITNVLIELLSEDPNACFDGEHVYIEDEE